MLEDDVLDKKAPIYSLSLPPTSTKGWARYVAKVAGAYKKPSAGVMTTLSIATEDDDTYFTISEEFDRELVQKELAVMLPRREEASKLLSAPFPKKEKGKDEPARPKKTRAFIKEEKDTTVGRKKKAAPIVKKFRRS